VPGLIGADKLHPTVAGYRRMAELFFTEIVSRYEMTPQAPTFSAVR
jgi:lysophospholipase L1-like esterase